MTNTDRHKYAEIYVDRLFKQTVVCAALNCTASFENFDEFWKHVDRVHWKDGKTGSHGDFEKTVVDKKVKVEAIVDLTESDCEDDMIPSTQAIVDILRGASHDDKVEQTLKRMHGVSDNSDIKDEPPTCVLTPQPSPSISLGAYEVDNVSCRVSRNSNSTNTENDASTSQGSATTFNQHQNNSRKQQKLCQTTESSMLRKSPSNHPQPPMVQTPLTSTSVNSFGGYGNFTTQHQHNHHNRRDFSEIKDKERTKPKDLSFNTRATPPPSYSFHQAQQSMARLFQNPHPHSSSPCEMDSYETWRLTRNPNVTAPSSLSLDNRATTSTNNRNIAIQQNVHSPTTQQIPQQKCAKRRSTIYIDTPHKLSQRRKTVVGLDATFKCDLCFQKPTFVTKKNYDTHVKRFHSPEDPSKDTVYCETCDVYILTACAQKHPYTQFHLKNVDKKMNGQKINRRRKTIDSIRIRN